MGAAALKGTVDRRVFADDSTGFAILTLRPAPGSGRKGTVSIKGDSLSAFKPGQGIAAIGRWVKHAKYGEQFVANSAEETIPTDTLGMARWLNDIAIPGIGPVTAGKLASAFGDNTIARIAEGDPDARMILGRKFDDAQKAMTERHAEASFGPLLAGYGIGKKTRAKIFAKYGLETARVIQSDPYRLIRDIEGIAFSTADEIAHATGTASLDRSRLQAAAIDALRFSCAEGNTAVSYADLAKLIRERTDVDMGAIMALMADIGDENAIATTLVIDGESIDAWALAEVDRAEQRFAEAVMDKMGQRALLTVEQAEHFITLAVEHINASKKKNDRVSLNTEQHAAAVMALTSGLSIVTGGPGTGKTFTLNVIVKAWRLAARAGLTPALVSLAAPTGKASQRMKEATGIAAKTLHRLLEAGGDGFKRDRLNPLDMGFVAIDETSMKDIWLAGAFARAWGKCPVLLIGDPDQLASVGPGRVLGDLIDSGVVPVTKLIEIRRQAKGSAIAEGAKAIRLGNMPEMSADGSSDLMFFEMDDSDEATAEAAETAAMLHDAYVKAGLDVQLLTPGHKAETGTIEMNQVLQEAAALTGPSVEIGGGCVAHVGDRVIQLENDKDLEVFNGDTGVVMEIGAGKAVVRFGDRNVEMDEKALLQLGLAYALTVHKAQGSEYDVVIMTLTTSHYSLLRRTLFYTGLTRAKSKCIVIGTRRALEIAIRNDDGRARTTTLAWRLRAMAG